MGTETRRTDWDHAAALCGLHGFTHRDAMIGLLRPYLSVAGIDVVFGINFPDISDDFDQTLAGFA